MTTHDTPESACPTCGGPVTIEDTQHEQGTIVGTERWTERRYIAASPTTHDTPEPVKRVFVWVDNPTTHDTPEAALAAALDEAGVVMPNVRSLHDPGGTPNRLRQATEVLAALDGWTLVNEERLAAAIEDHFATGRHGWSYTSCATAVVMALAGPHA